MIKPVYTSESNILTQA